MGNRARSWLPLLVCLNVFSVSGCFFMSTCGFRVLFFYQLYFVILQLRKLTSNMSLFISSIPSPLLEYPATSFLPIAFSSISKWPITLFLLIPHSQGLVVILVWWQLIIFFMSKLLIRSSILLLYILDNSTTSFCNFLPCLNACFNICFLNRVRIILVLSGYASIQVLAIRL